MLTELLKQPQNSPLPVAKQVMSLFAGIHGFMEKVDLKDVLNYEAKLFRFMDTDLMDPFKPYLDYLFEDTSFNVEDNPFIDILDFYTLYVYTDDTV